MRAPIAAASVAMRTTRRSLVPRTARGRPERPSRSARCLAPPAGAAEIPAIARASAAEKKVFTDSEIIEGFLKTAFGAEYHLAGRVDRIRKYDDAGAGVRRRHPRRPQGAAREDRGRHRRQGSASRHRHDRDQRRRQRARSSWCATAISIAPSRRSTAANGRARSAPRSIRNACRAFARTRSSRSSIPT